MSQFLITQSLVKKHLLNRAKVLRPHHAFTRVSDETIIHLDNQFRLIMDSFIKSHPAKGQTLKP